MSSETREGPKVQLDERVRGVLVMVVGTAALLAIAYAAMTLLTAPGGWAMRAANSPSGEAVESPQLAASVEEQQ